ncbi:hypothetical protein Mal52_37300 [Symmachiella dynata]|uniref:Uncharacterized protein n=1 Tax=Symmachiella dynata TaxID=2527995 RepID=A0A517ZRX4_9PLAN|nr:hypothetical protein Mal52_37300 [Symmachiella dynata]
MMSLDLKKYAVVELDRGLVGGTPQPNSKHGKQYHTNSFCLNQEHYRLSSLRRNRLPSQHDTLQIRVTGRQKVTIRVRQMQRICSVVVLAGVAK